MYRYTDLYESIFIPSHLCMCALFNVGSERWMNLWVCGYFMCRISIIRYITLSNSVMFGPWSTTRFSAQHVYLWFWDCFITTDCYIYVFAPICNTSVDVCSKFVAKFGSSLLVGIIQNGSHKEASESKWQIKFRLYIISFVWDCVKSNVNRVLKF